MPKLSPRQFAKVLRGVTDGLAGKELDQASKKFINLVKSNHMVKRMDEIMTEFKKLMKQEAGIDHVTITTAHKINKDEAKKIASTFSESCEVTTEVEPTLLGGAQIQKNNVIYDASVKAQLDALKKSL